MTTEQAAHGSIAGDRAKKTVTGSAGGTTKLLQCEQFVNVIPPGSGTHTVYLPSNPIPGANYFVKTTQNASGTVTVVDDGKATTAISKVLTAAKDFVQMVWDGFDEWHCTNSTLTT